jgi:hypothetical protein
MTKKATPPIKPMKLRGWLVCDDCTVVAEFHSLGEGPGADGGWPMHRCGYDIRPFTEWRDTNPHREPIYTPPEKGNLDDHQDS